MSKHSSPVQSPAAWNAGGTLRNSGQGQGVLQGIAEPQTSPTGKCGVPKGQGE